VWVSFMLSSDLHLDLRGSHPMGAFTRGVCGSSRIYCSYAPCHVSPAVSLLVKTRYEALTAMTVRLQGCRVCEIYQHFDGA